MLVILALSLFDPRSFRNPSTGSCCESDTHSSSPTSPTPDLEDFWKTYPLVILQEHLEQLHLYSCLPLKWVLDPQHPCHNDMPSSVDYKYANVSLENKKIGQWEHLFIQIIDNNIANLISKLNFYKLIPYPMDNCFTGR